MAERCLYEALGVERSASSDEIRSAYRKQALRWHPDKIQQSGASAELCQEATERFQAISRAYEVLNDPSERAWYDSHRSEILSSGDAGSEFEFNLWPYFSPSAFFGYGDTGKGFYAVYSSVFKSLFEQEVVFARAYLSEKLDPSPAFGSARSSHEEVSRFYNFWSSFKTVKDFAWCDEYRLADAPNRKVRRLMVEENSKIRKREQREFNEAVRQLVTFVKKRDKRVLERQVELQRIQKEKEEEMRARKQQQRQEQLSRVKEYEEQEWSKVDEKLYDWDADEKEKSKDSGRQEFYCVICEKRFRSQKQWENHEKSKKHIERASALKETFLQEDEQSEEEQASLSKEDTQEFIFSGREDLEQVEESVSEVEESDDEASLLAAMLNSQQTRSQLGKDDEGDRKVNRKQKNKQQRQSGAAAERHSSMESELTEDLASIRLDIDSTKEEEADTVEEHRKKATDTESNEERSAPSVGIDGVTDDEERVQVHTGNRKKGKAKGKARPSEPDRQRPAEADRTKKTKSGKKKAVATPSTECKVCGQEFESRNLLFKHIDANKHFVLKTN